MPTSRREAVVQRLDSVGGNRVLECVARRHGVLALAYHRIGSAEGQPFDEELYSASADEFRAQMLYLRERFDVLSLDSLLSTTKSGHLDSGRPCALVTFDDGYLDNHAIALPILEELGLPAVFFVAAGYIDSPGLPWWDRVAYIVKNTSRDVLELDYPARLSIPLRSVGRQPAIQLILKAYKKTFMIDQQVFFDRLEAQAGVSVDPTALGRDLFMSWEQVRQLTRAGMEVGSHTYTHAVLSQVSREAQHTELRRSKERIEAELGVAVRSLAYPVGGLDRFSGLTKELAREVGYDVAFSYYGGFNRDGHDDLFDIRRVAVERYHSFPMFRFRASMTNLWGRNVF